MRGAIGVERLEGRGIARRNALSPVYGSVRRSRTPAWPRGERVTITLRIEIRHQGRLISTSRHRAEVERAACREGERRAFAKREFHVPLERDARARSTRGRGRVVRLGRRPETGNAAARFLHEPARHQSSTPSSWWLSILRSRSLAQVVDLDERDHDPSLPAGSATIHGTHRHGQRRRSLSPSTGLEPSHHRFILARGMADRRVPRSVAKFRTGGDSTAQVGTLK